ncbi:MAG: hypothetical protein K6G28_06180 [Acholeplasmatales bacterium]|nr:hypothetical protein [Acholeplasmatales bacterium]
MTNQELLNKASRSYIDLMEFIKDLAKKLHKENKTKDLIKDLDLLIQVMLMYESVSDFVVSDMEISFIKHLVTECDIVDFYNTANNKKINWDSLRSDKIEPEEFKEFVDRVYRIAMPYINDFIMFLAGEDSVTSNNELEVILDYLRAILKYYLEMANTDLSVSDYVIKEIFEKKYRECRNIFSRIDKIF